MNGKDSARSPSFFVRTCRVADFGSGFLRGPGMAAKRAGFLPEPSATGPEGGRDPAAADYSCESTRSSIDAPDHWLIRRFSERMRWPSQAIFRSISKGRVASMSLPAGSVWGTM